MKPDGTIDWGPDVVIVNHGLSQANQIRTASPTIIHMKPQTKGPDKDVDAHLHVAKSAILGALLFVVFILLARGTEFFLPAQHNDQKQPESNRVIYVVPVQPRNDVPPKSYIVLPFYLSDPAQPDGVSLGYEL